MIARHIAAAIAAVALLAGFAHAAPRLAEVRPLRTTLAQYETFEAVVDFTATFENPFDSADIHVSAQIQGPDNLHTVSGFLYQPFERQLVDGVERLTPAGDREWRIRYTPTAPGNYSYLVTITNRHGRTFSRRQRFTVTPREADGFVRRSANGYFHYDNDKPFFGVGQNLAWAGAAGTYDFDAWLEGLAGNGANFVRLWFWRNPVFDLEVMPDRDGKGGVGDYSLSNAWRLDHVLKRCEELDIKVMLCIFDFHPLSEYFSFGGRTSRPWENCVYNRINGGMLRYPENFFSDQEAIASARRLLRYIVSRYGHSTTIMSWELFNEVDLAPGYRFRNRQVLDWHQQMARLINAIDPYDRPVTTSTSVSDAASGLWEIPEIAIVQAHIYNSADLAESVASSIRTFDKFKKPHLFGELGNDYNFTGDKQESDPNALHLHNAFWTAIATGSAATPMSWWWDSYIHPRNLYSIYRVPARFTKNIAWHREQFHPIEIEMEAYGDGVQQGTPLTAFIHGEVHKAALGDGLRFEVNYANDGTFAIHVNSVADGGVLEIYLNDRRALRQELPASRARGDWKDLEWNQIYSYWTAIYDRTYSIDVPRGRHSITVRNSGRDWIKYDHIELVGHDRRGRRLRISTDATWDLPRFATYQIAADGTITGYRDLALRAWGITGNTTTIIWVQNRNNTWSARANTPDAPSPTRAVITIPSPNAGTYEVQWWDTRTGRIAYTGTARSNGITPLRLATPPISTDMALKLVKE